MQDPQIGFGRASALRPDDRDGDAENASLRRAARHRADEAAASLENWLRRAMTKIAERSADRAAPVDLTDSLAAMAALLNEAARDQPGGDKPMIAADYPAQNEGAGGPMPPSVSVDAPRARAISSPAAQSAKARARSELTARLDELEHVVRAGGDAATDPSLRLALEELEARLKSSARQRPEVDGPASRPKSAGTGGPAPAPPNLDGGVAGGSFPSNEMDAAPAEQPAAAAIETLAPELHALTRQIEAAQRQLDEKVETGLQSLSLKLEAARERGPGDLAMDALEEKIAAITQRLEMTDLGFASIANLERTIGRLAEQFGQGAGGKRSSPDWSGAAREEADRRVHLALNAVQESVGQIANRLARIEADIGEPRPARDGSVEDPVRGTDGRPLAQTLLAAPHEPDGGRRDESACPNAAGDDFLIEPGSGFPGRFSSLPFRPAADADLLPEEAGAIHLHSSAAATPAQIPADPPAERAPRQSFFATHRASVVAGLAAISLALGVIALAKTGAIKPARPMAALKPSGEARTDPPATKSAAALKPVQAEVAPPVAPQDSGSAAVGGASEPGPSAPAQPETLKAADLSLFDPAALNAGPAGAIWAAAAPGEAEQHATPLTRLIAGSDPIFFEDIIARTEQASAPGGVIVPSLSPALLLKSAAPPSLAPANLARLAGTPLDELRAHAASGDAAEQFELGARYADGRAGILDLALAADYYAKAASSGLALAQYRLATMTEKGAGVSRDLGRAKALYEAAAAQGNARAMHNLGVLAAQGDGARPDYKTAAAWFEQAANFDVGDSQFNLAVLLSRGLGTVPDAGRAYVWFSIAAAGGDAEADRKRAEIAAALPREDLETAKAAVLSFKPRPLDPLANELSLTSSRAARN